jgi:hypothetical protein
LKILGIDFTSAPSLRKPITLAAGWVEENQLYLTGLADLPRFSAFETLLNQPDTWFAAMDFPFGQPARLIKALGWPPLWAHHMEIISSLEKPEFEALLLNYSKPRPYGDKHHFRPTDTLTRSSSPMKLHYPPVGKMFFQGAVRLYRSDVSVLPCRPLAHSSKVAMEGYPALLARALAPGSYKSDTLGLPSAERDKRCALRRQLLEGILSPTIQKRLGFTVHLGEVDPEAFIEDPSGDRLDALFCALQAAWAYTQAHQNYGIPTDCDPNEGWIIHPFLA